MQHFGSFGATRPVSASPLDAIIESVEHACPQCNSPVEDKSPFCPQCGAAQVRFSAPERVTLPVLVALTDSGSSTAILGSRKSQAQPFQAENARASIRAAVYAGMIAAALSAVPVAGNFILALPIAGFLSVLFYRRWSHGPEPTPNAAFRLGAVTGAVGFVLLLVIAALGMLTFQGQAQVLAVVREFLRQQQARATDPEMLRKIDYLMTPQGMAALLVCGALLTGVIFILLSGAGAAMSASLLRRKDPPHQ